MRWDRCYRKKKIFFYTLAKTMKKVVGSVGIGFVNEDFWKKKWQHLSFYREPKQ